MTHIGEKKHVCKICKKGCTHAQNLNMHFVTHTSEKPHVCEICKNAFTCAGHLKVYLITHTGESHIFVKHERKASHKLRI